MLNLEIFGVAWQDLLQRGPKLQPPVTALPVAPFAAHDGAAAVHYLRPGYIAMNMLKKAPDDRIRELLRVINWLAAPFGSAEDLLLTVGVKDVDYTLDAQGNATPTDSSNADANLVNWKYHVQHPQVAYATGVPSYANWRPISRSWLFPRASLDPSGACRRRRIDKSGVSLNQTFLDGSRTSSPAAARCRTTTGGQRLADQRRQSNPDGISAGPRRRRLGCLRVELPAPGRSRALLNTAHILEEEILV